MTTIQKIAAALPVGTRVICLSNTAIPASAGVVGVVKKAGARVFTIAVEETGGRAHLRAGESYTFELGTAAAFDGARFSYTYGSDGSRSEWAILTDGAPRPDYVPFVEEVFTPPVETPEERAAKLAAAEARRAAAAAAREAEETARAAVVARVYSAYLARRAELTATGKYPYNADFVGRLGEFADAAAESEAIYDCQRRFSAEEHAAKVDALLADGFHEVTTGECPSRFSSLIIVEQGAGRPFLTLEGARVHAESTGALFVTPKGKRTNGYRIHLGRRVLARA